MNIEILEMEFADQGNAVLMNYRSGDLLVGTVTISWDEIAAHGFLHQFYVRPEFESQGVREQLAQGAIKNLWERGFHRVFLYEMESARKAVRFWFEMGFAPVSPDGWEVPGSAAVFMAEIDGGAVAVL
tara:strand:+ start:2686 stop:3069 length:384 start_codon:yes stop_codon:yes gene_type:complete